MNEPSEDGEFVFRDGTANDVEVCLALWVTVCAVRDGEAISGVAERARPKFEDPECWILVEQPATGSLGFVLAIKPGNGLPTDPPDAPVVALLAVAPAAQGSGLGGMLLSAVAVELARRNHRRSVLHVLAENHTAVRLYERKGWRALASRSSILYSDGPRRHTCWTLTYSVSGRRTSTDTEFGQYLQTSQSDRTSHLGTLNGTRRSWMIRVYALCRSDQCRVRLSPLARVRARGAYPIPATG
ncbi:N-acetyltransferase family protein [Mycetocola sp.]|uniref:GNAT family N-acetyltransferase n=1 Tax=Mycetocola sp. TaxID=1871042 RepID=UPI003988EC45